MKQLADYALALIGGFVLGTAVWALAVWLIVKATLAVSPL